VRLKLLSIKRSLRARLN